MRSTTRSGKTPLRVGTLMVALALALAIGARAAEPQICEGYAKDQKVERYRVHPFSSKPAKSLQDLQQIFRDLEGDVRSVLQQEGAGEAADGLFEAIGSGALTERNVSPGETLAWMASRKKGQLQVTENVCIATKKLYDAYQVPVSVEGAATKGTPTCRLEVTQDPDTKTFHVDASGSSPGVEVKMSTPDGSRTVIASGGGTTWSGPIDDPYHARYTFTATAEAQGSKSITTYEFLIPKVCLNLSLVTKTTTERPGEGEVGTCEKTVTVGPIVPPPASCTITAPATVERKADASIDVTGHWVDDKIQVTIADAKGRQVNDPHLAPPFPNTVQFRKAGTYTLTCTATNEVGDTATNTATVVVERTEEWAFRPYLAYLDGQRDEHLTSEMVGSVEQRTKLGVGDARGFGLGLEYYLSDRVGVNGDLLYGRLHSSVVRDLGELWGMDDDKLSYLSVTVGPNFHLTPNGRVDFYVGPFLGLVDVGDGSYDIFGGTVKRSFGSEFVWGALLGLDVPFTSSSAWGVHAGARYINLSVSPSPGSFDLSVDPKQLELGLSYKF